MDFEKLYSKLPDMIRYNNFVLNFSLNIAKKIRNLNKKSNMLESQKELLELLFLDYNIKVTGTLRNTQLLNLELLRFIVNVCDKYNINYWLNAGTLLGAVRHDGFIPWDDDVDLSFMREDYERFIEMLPNEINKYDYFKHECGLTLLRDNENYFADFCSVYDFEGDESLFNEDEFMFLQLAWMKPYVKIDCFPQNYVRENKLDYFNKKYIITKYRFYEEIRDGKKSFNNEFDVKSEEVGFTNDRAKYINDTLDTLNLYPPLAFKVDEVFPLSTIDFEGYSFKCPHNTNYYLKKLFGSNYMKLPDIIETHNFVKFIESQFPSKKEMDEKFEKDINYLRRINDEFKRENKKVNVIK